MSWGGDWIELGGTDEAPEVVAGLASVYNYLPVIEAQFFTQSSGELLRPLNEATKEAYRNMAVDFAKKYKPAYMAFGIEVNFLYDVSSEEFNDFAQFFGEVHDSVEAVSPSTKVFTIFSLEKMKGLNGGLFGGVNDPSKAQWSLLNSFPKSDIIAFTTYPDLIYHDPSEIPADYYSEISLHTNKPIAFTETGWHSGVTPEGWEGSDSKEAEFITKFFSLTGSLKPELRIWSFLYDQNTVIPFNSMGLRQADGSTKPAWQNWINAQ